jgi:ElaB/YqjD/DUF883 family membrane-anchored ribosome-binding protein
MAQGSPARASDKISDLKEFDLKENVSEGLSTAGDQAENVVRRLAEQGREAGKNIQQVAGNIKGAVDKSVQDQPMAALALVAAVGFVLGALWKS